MVGGPIVYISIFFSFIIGLVCGGVFLFVWWRMRVNRQLRFAERKAAKMVADSRNEAKDVMASSPGRSQAP